MPAAQANNPIVPSNYFTVSQSGAHTIVQFADGSMLERPELDDVERELIRVVDQGHTRVILDMSKIDYIASRPLGVILNLHRKLWRLSGGELVLVGVSPKIMQVLQVTKLDKLLTVKPTAKDVTGQ